MTRAIAAIHAAAARSVVLFGICANGSDFEIAAAQIVSAQVAALRIELVRVSRPAQLDSESSAALISTAH